MTESRKETSSQPIEIPPGEFGGIIDDLISIAETLRETGDEVVAGLINNIVDQLIGHMPG